MHQLTSAIASATAADLDRNGTRAQQVAAQATRLETSGAVVTVYTRRLCPYCRQAKRALEEHHIPFREIGAREAGGRRGLRERFGRDACTYPRSSSARRASAAPPSSSSWSPPAIPRQRSPA
jgi:hypothetical protein